MRRWPEARKSLNEALRDIQDRCNGSSADKCNTWRPVAPIGPRGSEDDRVRSRRGVKKHLRDPPLHSQTELMPRFNPPRSLPSPTDYYFKKVFQKSCAARPARTNSHTFCSACEFQGSLALVLEAQTHHGLSRKFIEFAHHRDLRKTLTHAAMDFGHEPRCLSLSNAR